MNYYLEKRRLKAILTLTACSLSLLQGCAPSLDALHQEKKANNQKSFETNSKKEPLKQKSKESLETQETAYILPIEQPKKQGNEQNTLYPYPSKKIEDNTNAEKLSIDSPIQESKLLEQNLLKSDNTNETPRLDKPDNYVPDYNPDVRAPSKLNHPLQESTDITFMLGEDNKGYYLYGEGAIVEGAYKKFKSYVEFYAAKNIKLDRLMMHSPGGLVNEGLAIGRYIRKNSWATDADKYMQCYSSCGFIYAGGVKKHIQAGAKVGYHRPYIPGLPDTEQFIRKVYQDYQPYWISVDGDSNLYDKFMKNYGRDEMYILTTDNISQYMKVEQY